MDKMTNDERETPGETNPPILYDDEALWDLYADPHAADRHLASAVRDGVGDEIADEKFSDGSNTVIQAVKVHPDLTVELHVPCATLEDGCLAEVGSMVWDCSLAMARYVEAQSTNKIDCRGDHLGAVNPSCYDHVIELGSGLGLLGIAVYHQLVASRPDGAPYDRQRNTRVTLTDHVHELIGVLHLSVARVLAREGLDRNVPHAGELTVKRLDWSDDNSELTWINQGESLLIIGSELVYEPVHATILCACIQRLLERAGNEQQSRVLVANFMDRPGWTDFVLSMRRLGGDIRNTSVTVSDFDLGGGGYELLDMKHVTS